MEGRMKSQGWLWSSVVLAGMTVTLSAQAPKPTFEVASVKPRQESTAVSVVIPGRARVLPGGVFSATYTSVEHLLMFAYDLRDYRIVGGPDWLRRDKFEIRARAETDAPADQIKLMVRSLLEDRFKLVTHVEPREMRYNALVLARPNGFLGPGIFSIDECTPVVVNELRRKFPEKYPTPSGPGMTSGCSPTGVNAFADYLSFRLGTPFIDETGLKGGFYYTVRSQWPTGLGFGVEVSDPSLPALSTALEEQLGLRLESRRGPLEVLVIDSVQQPTEN
jgi:uncharacterized protein (TIGR03435 family)